MNSPTQHRSWVSGICGRAAGAALALAILFVPVVLVTGSAQAQTYTESVLHSFTGGTTDGEYPSAGLLRDAQGNLYGTTEAGGALQGGTVFKLEVSGNETFLYNFPSGVSNDAMPMCRCSKIMSPRNCNETLSPCKDGDDESERVPTGESD